jgi:DNA repair protein RecO (recombination protein O)
MRHKYATPAVILARSPLAEAGMFATLLTSEFGLIRAAATGARRPGAKLAHALQTLDESDVSLVRGKDGWRLTGAVLAQDHFHALAPGGRKRAARIASLLLRLVHGESADAPLFGIFRDFLAALPPLADAAQDGAEVLAALRLLAALGLDSGAMPPAGYRADAIEDALAKRSEYVKRINRGISASGL